MKRMAYVKVWKQVVEKHEVMRFEELSEDVQEKLIEKKQEKNTNDTFFWDFFDAEIKESWEAIADLLSAKLDYSYDTCSYSYTKLKRYDDGEYELQDSRAMAYIWNNWIEPALKGKYIGDLTKNNPHKFTPYYSKITKHLDCCFTGICYDNALVDAWEEWKSEFRRLYGWSHMDVEDFVKILQDKMTDYVIKEAEYRESKEYAKEELEDEDVWYFENGEIADVENIVEVA